MASPFQVWINPEGKGLVYYFFFFLLGSITRFISVPTILMALAVLRVACIWLLLWFLCLRIDNSIRHSIKSQTITATTLLAAMTFFFNSGARPEIFIFFLTISAMHIFRIAPDHYHYLIGGAFLGIAFVSHPLQAGLLGLCLFLYFASTRSAASALKNTFKALIITLITSSILIFAYPDGAIEWLNLLKISSSVVGLDRTNEGWSFWNTWMFNTYRPFYGLIYIFSMIGLPLFLARKKESTACWQLQIIATGSLVFAFFHFGLYEGYRSNYLMSFLPMVLIINHELCLSLFEEIQKHKKLIAAAICLSLFLASAGFVRSLALFPPFLQHGLSYTEARKALSELRSQTRDSVTLTTALFSLTENYEGLNHPAWCYPEKDSKYIIKSEFAELKESPILMLQQVNIPIRNKLEPPEIKGYKLIKDVFSRHQPEIFGIKIANTPRGYNYAIYKAEKP